MKDLVIIFDMAENLGFDLSALTVDEAIQLKANIKTVLETAVKKQ